jgi:NAD-dependent dihydropyrimidine dehydrogenase PreA subunit
MGKGTDRLKRIQTPYVGVNLRKCKACWECVAACPKQVIGKVGFLWHKHIVFRNSDNCSGCQKCIKICPHGVFIHQ